MGVAVAEVTENIRALIQRDPRRFGIMVERQVQSALLPRLAGSRRDLEAPLWELLIMLVAGADADAPELNDEALARWQELAFVGTRADGTRAAFPKAAAGVARALADLREHGALPAPRLQPGEETSA